ncbi:unnamed protein product [Rotaria sordida]|uniref:F-box domain-containing protein n=1 Tax=Rotaria sordida TaxID=392033 RepID=A0A814ZXN7_9BILA|nr:unnamed protein product [Rotaria sordida]CAF1531195.1 unnamed protein product [Rotaria sordida]
MKNKLEILPNEILLNIFVYFSWDELLISFWSFDKRINNLIYSIFEINQNGIIFDKPGLSYKKFSKILLPLIFNSLSLCSFIKYIHVDGINSICFNLIYQDIFSHNDDKSILRFPNLKSLYISRCLLSESLIQTLSFLIQLKLNKLTLTFDEDIYETFSYECESSSILSDQGN